MIFTTITELNEEFQRHTGRLRLDHYLVIEPTNKAADHFLYGLELTGILPRTVTWVSKAGWQARLYQNPFEGKDLITIGGNFFGLQFRFGSGQDYLVVNDDNSILDREVAALPEKALMLFRQLMNLADYMVAYLDAPLELGSEAFRYRQIL
jgi:hypothetical protein